MQLPLLFGQANNDGMLARPRTRLVLKHHPSGTDHVGGIGDREYSAIVVMDYVDAEHLRILALRASGA